jgi:NhaA family Na+:H+ antiporter
VNSSRDFIKLETAGANLLLGTTVLALIISNSPWHEFYKNIFLKSAVISLGVLPLKLNLKFLINEVLMTVFFLVAGLEIKYEFLQGELNSYKKALLPVIAAMGGMIAPALIYILFNYHDSLHLRGWAIPTATDIAFSLGILSLLGSRVIPSLKTFLMALAIIDDLIAIMIIAFFYTNHLSFFFLSLSIFCLLTLFLLHKKGITHLLPYVLIGSFLWISLFFAGVHPTLAGVALAFSIPLNKNSHKKQSPLHHFKELLHPIVVLGILPLFAFANAGISFFNISIKTLQTSITFGILMSLFVGKQIGIFGASWLAVKLRIAHLPEKVRWLELYAIAIICGIGFTISLFIGALAFGDINNFYLDSVKIGVLSGSLLSGLIGYLLLFFTKRQ